MNDRLIKLEAFFKAIARLTGHHDVIHDYAAVTADKLGKELEKVDPEWWKIPQKPMTEEEKKNRIDTYYD
jgi:hypothetical protein